MSWPLLMLKELGTVHTGSTPKTNDDSLFGGDVPFVTPSDLGDINPIQSTPRTLTDAGVKTADLLPTDSVLVCCIGSLGKIGFAGRPVVTNQQINAVVFNPAKMYARFGFYACRMLRSQLELMAPATTVPIVNKSRFSELKIPVPPLEEQRRIAAILDQAETLRTQRGAALAQLDSLSQSIFLDMFGDPVTNPKGWSMRKIGEVGLVHTGKTPPSQDAANFAGIIPFVTPGDLDSDLASTVRYLSDLGATHCKVVRPGSSLVSCIGNIGKLGKARIQTAFNQQINAVEWTALVDDTFGLAALEYAKPQMLARSSATTLPILNKSNFSKVEVVVPPLPLQKTFATRIQAIESLKATHRAALAELDALFASLQQRAFAGEL